MGRAHEQRQAARTIAPAGRMPPRTAAGAAAYTRRDPDYNFGSAMSGRIYATIGRSPDCDVVLDHPTVSSHHARLSWTGATLLVEDLASANGTFVDDKRIRTARVRPGSEIRCGVAVLPWSHEGLRRLLRAGAGRARTLAMPRVGAGAYVCGACGHLGELLQKKAPSKIRCERCGAVLRARADGGRGWVVWASVAVVLLVAGAAAAAMAP